MAGILRVGTKLGVVSGVVYASNKIGVWGDSTRSEQIYKDLCYLTNPYLQDMPVEIPELPHIADVISTTKTYWNSGVLKTGRFILELPEISSALAKRGYSTLLNQINSSSDNSTN